MNRALSAYTITGRVVDIGGGRSPDYFEYLKKEKFTSIELVDFSFSRIDFEKDALPFADASVDTVLCMNTLEHVYNYRFLTAQMYRVLKKDGKLIGFVPFLINYHPDPHDFFRYTKESLTKIFIEAGFADISIRSVGGGSFLVNYNMIMLSLPKVLRVLMFPCYLILDRLFLKFRPKAAERYPLGYVFVATTPK